MAAGTTTDILALLDAHYEAFFAAKPYADKTLHPVPCHTSAWSQILVSLLTGINGRERKKGTDLVDGSDVKAANCWSAIDTPRFNGAIPAGRKSKTSRKAPNVSALDDVPYIFFVLWDDTPEGHPRCRVWCVRANQDKVFHSVCKKWYTAYAKGQTSNNFQLHPPRYRDHDIFRNDCGSLAYPLLFCAVRKDTGFKTLHYDPDVLTKGQCEIAPATATKKTEPRSRGRSRKSEPPATS